MNTQKIYMAIAAVALMGLAACTNDELGSLFHSTDSRVNFTATTDADASATRGLISESTGAIFEGTQDGRPLMLTTTVTGRSSATTRGLRFGDKEGDKIDSFRVSAIKTIDEVSVQDFAAAKPEFFYNLKATKNTNDIFEIEQDYYWPTSKEKLWFYAYMPGDTTGIEVSSKTTGGAQKVTFTVDANVTKQVDLMTANTATQGFTNVSGNAKKASVPLEFRHELTAIRFVIGEQWLAGSIKSIAIKGVHGKGTLTIGGGWEWKDKSGNAVTTLNDYTLTVNKSGLNGTNEEQFMDDTNGENIDFSKHYFLMIPQSFNDNDNAVVEVKYWDGSSDYTVTAPLKGQDPWVRNTTVTYAISSHTLTKLKINEINWPAAEWTGAKSSFVENDQVGLYVVDTNNHSIIYNNIPCTYNGSAWSVKHDTNEGPVYHLPGYQYFFYYPYTENLAYPLTGQGVGNSTEAEDFFSSVIVGWDTPADQRDEDVMKNCDLQIAKATDFTNHSSTVNVTMAHAMGMAKVELQQVNLPVWKYLSTDDTYQWSHGTSQNHTASGTFETYLPYGSGTTWYYMYNPRKFNENHALKTKSITMSATGENGWTANVSFTNGAVTNLTTPPSRTKVLQSYTMETGDVLYSDGALSRNTASTLYSDKTAIALVFATSTSTTDNNTYGWKHGYAISIRRAANPKAFAATSAQCVVNSTAIAPSEAIADKDGYQHCKDVQDYASSHNEALSSYPAINACLNYSARNKANNGNVSLTGAISTSKWFLPSTGQWVDIAKNLGGAPTPAVQSDRLYFEPGANAVSTCTSMKNTFDAKIAVLTNAGYSELSVLKADDHTGYWTSSQYAEGGRAFEIFFQSYSDVYPYDKLSAGNGTGNTWYARPCIAF